MKKAKGCLAMVLGGALLLMVFSCLDDNSGRRYQAESGIGSSYDQQFREPGRTYDSKGYSGDPQHDAERLAKMVCAFMMNDPQAWSNQTAKTKRECRELLER